LKRRLMRATQLAFHRDPFVSELEKSGAKSWADVASSLKKEALVEDDLMERVRQTLDELRTATKQAGSMMTASDRNTQDIFLKVEGLEIMFKKMLPVYEEVYKKCYGQKSRNENGEDLYVDVKTTVEKAYHPDYMEKIIRLDASIDTRIDKTLSRLVSIKTYKRIEEEAKAKQLSSPKSIAA
jgi:hypothetical protein